MAASHLFLQELGLQGEGTFDYHLVARLQAVQDLRATPYDLAGPHRHRHEATISIATEDDGVALQLHQGFGGNRQAGRGRTRVTRTCWRIEQDFDEVAPMQHVIPVANLEPNRCVAGRIGGAVRRP